MPVRNDLVGVLVAQLLEKRLAALRDAQGLGEQLGRIDLGEADAQA